MSGAGKSLATKSQFNAPEHFPPLFVDNFFQKSFWGQKNWQFQILGGAVVKKYNV